MRITKYVLGLDGANRFDSFYSVGAPAQGFVRYSAVDNRDNITSLLLSSMPRRSVSVGIATRSPLRKVACSVT